MTHRILAGDVETALDAEADSGLRSPVETRARPDAKHAGAAPEIAHPAERLGHQAIGPVLHGFAQWIDDEVGASRAARGSPVHLLFLMQDGHLARDVHDAVAQRASARTMKISNFASTAAALLTEKSVRGYAAAEAAAETPIESILAQLLFKPKETAVLLRALSQTTPHAALLRRLQAGSTIAHVLRRTSAFADRLAEDVNALVAPASGDTVMLVDLGLDGSVGMQIAPMLHARLGVAVAVRSLLRSVADTQECDHRGFIDARCYAVDRLATLGRQVAVLDYLSAPASDPIIDEARLARPGRAATLLLEAQRSTRAAIRRGALDYTRAAAATLARPLHQLSPRTEIALLREVALAELPQLTALQGIEEQTPLTPFAQPGAPSEPAAGPLFARVIASRRLVSQRGTERTVLPAARDDRDLALRLALLAQAHDGLALHYADVIDRTITLPIVLTRDRTIDMAMVTAMPTPDGLFIAHIPIGEDQVSVGLQFGRLYEWLQIDSVAFVPADQGDGAGARAQDGVAMATLVGMEQAGPQLFRCDTEGAFMLVPAPTCPPASPTPRTIWPDIILTVVFRPIAVRDPVHRPGMLSPTPIF